MRHTNKIARPYRATKAKHFSSIKRWLVAILAKRLDVCCTLSSQRMKGGRWGGIKIDFPPISSKMFARIMGMAKGKTTNKWGWRGGRGGDLRTEFRSDISRLRAEPSGWPEKVAFISRASALIGAQRSRVKWTFAKWPFGQPSRSRETFEETGGLSGSLIIRACCAYFFDFFRDFFLGKWTRPRDWEVGRHAWVNMG